MIDRYNHYARYNELMALASGSAPARRNDGGYMAALYILSADTELYGIARSKIGSNGVSFSSLLSAARRAELSDSQVIAAKAAHSLFNGGSGSTAPCDLVHCDYNTLDIITDALYIRKGGRIPAADGSGQMYLDRSTERRHRSFEVALAQHFAAEA